MSTGWSTPSELRAQVQRQWERGRLLSRDVEYPLPLRLKRPAARDLGERFDEVRAWIRELDEGSRDKRGFGYVLGWQEVSHRQLGKNRVPSSAVVPSEEDALRLVGKTREAARFRELLATTAERCPAACAWVERRPLEALMHAADWERVLHVLRWFQAHPRPGVYLRQLDVPSVDTKFIEGRRGLLAELLDLALPTGAVDGGATGAKGFERRYGLLERPARVRLRSLDPTLSIGGLYDVTAPVQELARLSLPLEAVFITENEINGLAFPDVPRAVVVFGLGYGVDVLAELGWLAGVSLLYWGDIDTHGFAILDRLRSHLPGVRSLLMDRETLLAHRGLWVEEAAHQRHEGELARLTPEERAVFEDLRRDRLGPRVRLEQERVSFGAVRRAIAGALGGGPS